MELAHDDLGVAGRQLRHFGLDDAALTDLVWSSLDGIVFQQLALGRIATSRASLERLRGILRAEIARAASDPS
ncbi:hypothetical protein SAMN04489806_2240 [Paramicrobacterium humi]|uniref:Uncharacterized protein n=1 Tax=Paramicrobacterium humi TaxID=640635 RepID=A0A1H4NM39_9MICO|nr:hypothetical protein [Microbacterium humi]SEB96280.1 hypothetical protein SAMN04489806_2240 [Microbacterium humi]